MSENPQALDEGLKKAFISAKEAMAQNAGGTLAQYAASPSGGARWNGGYSGQTITLNPSQTPALQLRRLTTHNDWTIARDSCTGELIAFDSTGQHIESKERKLVLDGVAFCYKDGRLFSGKIVHTPSEQEVRDAALREKYEKAAKHNEKIAVRIRKLERMYK